MQAIDKKAFELAMRFLRAKYRGYQAEVRKRIKPLKHMTKQQRKEAVTLTSGSGGMMRFIPEEICPNTNALTFEDRAPRIEDLAQQFENAGSEPEKMFARFRSEADALVKRPKILDYEPEEESATVESFFVDDQTSNILKKKEIPWRKGSPSDIDFT